MAAQEDQKTMPFGEIWTQYCRICGVPADGEWFGEVEEYEKEILRTRG
jgi:L-rhamnose isomerase